MNNEELNIQNFYNILKPETELEYFIINQPPIREGLYWGEPRYGHPEGKVLHHIPEVYANIERVPLPLSITDRERLRLITLLHDTFKNIEDKNEPRDWSKHHGILARLFAENYIEDSIVLDIIELHDEAYYCWRLDQLEYNSEAASMRLDFLFDRIKDCIQLYYIFFKCDTATGDKTQAPVKWFEKKIKDMTGVTLFAFKI